MAEPTKVYWDSCVWLALILGEAGRVDRCESLIELAKKGDVQIWTSSLTLAEVYKLRVGADARQLPADRDHIFEQFLEQDYIVEVQVDHDVGVRARDLLRQFSPPLKKCNDAVHLATAVLNDLDELHSFDAGNLLALNERVDRRDGKRLIIREPPPSLIAQQADLFVEAAVPPAGQAEPDGEGT